MLKNWTPVVKLHKFTPNPKCRVMKRIFTITLILSFAIGTSYAQSLDSIARTFSYKKLTGTIDSNYLAFKGNLDLNNVLKNPAERKDQMLKYALHDRFGMDGYIIDSPVDNMPVMIPNGNFPNRNFLPDPSHQYPMRIKRLDYMHTLTLDK